MATIDNRLIIEKLIIGDGYYQDDPRVQVITQYKNPFGADVWGIDYELPTKYGESEFVIDPIVVFDAKETETEWGTKCTEIILGSLLFLKSRQVLSGEINPDVIEANTRKIRAAKLHNLRWEKRTQRVNEG